LGEKGGTVELTGLPFLITDVDVAHLRKRLRRAVDRETHGLLPVRRDRQWKEKWEVKIGKRLRAARAPAEVRAIEAEVAAEVASWGIAPRNLDPDALRRRLLRPFLWLATRVLGRAAPRDRRRTADALMVFFTPAEGLAGIALPPKKKIRRLEFDVATGSISPSSHPKVTQQIYRPHGFIETELARLGPRELCHVYRISGQWLTTQLTELLRAAIRRLYPHAVLMKKIPAGRQIFVALVSDDPGRAITNLLVSVGWNQAAWARAASVHHTTISHLLAGGRLKGPTMFQLIDAFAKRCNALKRND
jgi:hypothetical protein